ncbi:MAG: PIN domain-containing protein [Oscillospiraceae bacterium]|nr:PIN domain-containing protein [Oscillospiraceae bacterium]
MFYSLDACTLILLFRKNPNVCAAITEKEKNNKIIIPPIAYYEVLRGFLNIGATTKTAKLKAMYENAYNLLQIPEKDVMEKGSEIYAELKQKGFTVGSNDILIAAWSILAESVLVTDNIKDFKNINELVIENWKEL